MQIFFASDLHFGVHPQGDAAVAALARTVCAEGSKDDVLLLGGDHAVDDEGIVTALELFEEFPGRRAAVPGNHDIWVRKATESSWERYHRLKHLFRASGFHPLHEGPMIIGDVGFAGVMGWYDGSFKDRELGIPDEAYESKVYPGQEEPCWTDAVQARWNANDETVTTWQMAELGAQLELLAELPSVVTLIHHLPTKRLLIHPRETVPRFWRFANAFLGSERFAERLAEQPNVRLALSGHIHMTREARIGECRFMTAGGGYQEKQLTVIQGDRVERRLFRG